MSCGGSRDDLSHEGGPARSGYGGQRLKGTALPAAQIAEISG